MNEVRVPGMTDFYDLGAISYVVAEGENSMRGMSYVATVDPGAEPGIGRLLETGWFFNHEITEVSK